jgi:hypothetical protein
MMIEIEVAPAARSGKALGILDGHIGAIELSAEKTAPGRLGARTIGKLCWQCELQFLEQDRPFRELLRLFVDLIGARLDVDVAGKPASPPLSALGVSGDPTYIHSWKFFGKTRSPEAVYSGS